MDNKPWIAFFIFMLIFSALAVCGGVSVIEDEKEFQYRVAEQSNCVLAGETNEICNRKIIGKYYSRPNKDTPHDTK